MAELRDKEAVMAADERGHDYIEGGGGLCKRCGHAIEHAEHAKGKACREIAERHTLNWYRLSKYVQQTIREAYDAGAKAQREQEEELCRHIAAELCNFDISCRIDHNARTVVLRQGRQ